MHEKQDTTASGIVAVHATKVKTDGRRFAGHVGLGIKGWNAWLNNNPTQDGN